MTIANHATEPVHCARCNKQMAAFASDDHLCTHCWAEAKAKCAVCHGTGKDPRFTVPTPCPACRPNQRKDGWSERLLRRGPHR